MSPIKIKVKVNNRPCWIHYFEKEMVKKPHNLFAYCVNRLLGRKPLLIERGDVRYQWALDSTDKEYLFVLHDDVMVTGNIVGKLLAAMGGCCDYRRSGPVLEVPIHRSLFSAAHLRGRKAL